MTVAVLALAMAVFAESSAQEDDQEIQKKSGEAQRKYRLGFDDGTVLHSPRAIFTTPLAGNGFDWYSRERVSNRLQR